MWRILGPSTATLHQSIIASTHTYHLSFWRSLAATGPCANKHHKSSAPGSSPAHPHFVVVCGIGKRFSKHCEAQWTLLTVSNRSRRKEVHVKLQTVTDVAPTWRYPAPLLYYTACLCIASRHDRTHAYGPDKSTLTASVFFFLFCLHVQHKRPPAAVLPV